MENEFTRGTASIFQEIGNVKDDLENKTKHLVQKADFEAQLEERWGQVKEILDADVETLREKGML